MEQNRTRTDILEGTELKPYPTFSSTRTEPKRSSEGSFSSLVKSGSLAWSRHSPRHFVARRSGPAAGSLLIDGQHGIGRGPPTVAFTQRTRGTPTPQCNRPALSSVRIATATQFDLIGDEDRDRTATQCACAGAEQLRSRLSSTPRTKPLGVTEHGLYSYPSGCSRGLCALRIRRKLQDALPWKLMLTENRHSPE